jgi:hypothetical protein
MKIDDEALKSFYHSYLENHKPDSRNGCPSFEEILGLIDNDVGRRRRESLIAHIFQCASCAEEFDILRQIRKQEAELVLGIEELSPSESVRPGRRARFFKMGFIWRYATILAGICLVFGLFSFIRNRGESVRPGEAGQRGGISAAITLLPPKRSAAPPHLWMFRWEASFPAESYQLDILDAALFPLVSVPNLKAKEYRLSEPLARKVPRDGRWFWMITALTSEGIKICSPLQRISGNE